MTVIAKDTVLQDSWNLLYNVLTSGVSDVGNTPARAGSDFIFSAWPNRATVNRNTWTAYPIIVLTTDITRGVNHTIGATMRDWEVGFQAEAYNKSQKNLDIVSDYVVKSLQNYQHNLTGSGLCNFTIDSMSTGDITDVGGALVHVKTINWHYAYRVVN